jgi:hypothetical protein
MKQVNAEHLTACIEKQYIIIFCANAAVTSAALIFVMSPKSRAIHDEVVFCGDVLSLPSIDNGVPTAACRETNQKRRRQFFSLMPVSLRIQQLRSIGLRWQPVNGASS